MKQYSNRFAVVVLICLKEIIFYILSLLNFLCLKYMNFLFSTVGCNIAANGRNYMQLPTAGGFPVEPHRRCCGLHGLLSARKRQLTYSFCYAVVFLLSS